MSSLPTSRPIHLVMFSHNRKDTAFVRRVMSLRPLCEQLTTFTFRRDGEPAEPGPDWDNIDLGYAEHAQFAKRLMLYLSALKTVFQQRKCLLSADVIHARNLDVFLFAWLTVFLCGFFHSGRPRMVYECLDVHEALTKQGVSAAILRWLERRVLKRSSLLIVSSPGFISHYFEPTQHYSGPVYLAENKLYFPAVQVSRPSLGDSLMSDDTLTNSGERAERPIRIAWVGIIRCVETLELLRALAVARPEAVEIHISGLVSYFLIPNFDERIAGLPNIVFSGAYEWPQGLGAAYEGADLVWSQELSWSGHNSDWLIPNRVYEGSFFAVPSLAVAGTETARFVDREQLGYVLPDAQPGSLIAFIDELNVQSLQQKKRQLLAADAGRFVASEVDACAYLSACVGAEQSEISILQK